jgi:hypothetical protein
MMEKTSTTREGDLVLVYFKDQPTMYARIGYIEPDVKKDWYRVTLQLLTMPVQVVTWILREEYINGAPFTMGGNPMKLEKIHPLPLPDAPLEKSPASSKKGSGKPAKVLPFKVDRE